MFKCKECNQEIKLQGNAHVQHLANTHNLSSYSYALKHYKIIGETTNNYRVSHSKQELVYLKNKDYECPICKLPLTENASYIESHIKRKHKILDYSEFYIQFYKNESGYDLDKIDDVCGLCETERLQFKELFDIDHRNKTYRLKERIVYACNTDKCKEMASINILGIPYSKETYESIGSRVDYLVKVHKKSEEYVKDNLKHGKRDPNKPGTVSLEHYQIRYGTEEGLRLYRERNRKIGKAQTLEYYIERHGSELGREKFKKRRNSLKRSTLGTNRSKAQARFKLDVLDEIDANCLEEYPFDDNNLSLRSDFYYEEFDTHIEFFGDYWHASRKTFSTGDIHKTLKIPVEDIWKRDEERIKKLTSSGSCVIIVWESTYQEYVKNREIKVLIKLIKDILYGQHRSKSFRL